MGLGGNVSNRPDGTVEIVVEGNPTQIEEFIREVRKGPPMGHVDRLEAHDVAITGTYSSFLIEGW
jgi:acylphosphatase